MSGEGVEVAAQIADVDGQVRHRLRAVHQHRHAARVGPLDDGADRVDGAERVGDVSDREKAGARPEQPLQLVELQLSALVDAGDPQRGAALRAEQLPGNQVRVVLERRDQHLVARPDAGAAEAVRHQIHRLGGAAQEDDLSCMRGADEALDFPARGFERGGRPFSEFVHAAVHVGVVLRVEARHSLDDKARLLRGGGGVQIDERAAVDRLHKRWKIAADCFDVQVGHGSSGPTV